MFYYYSLKWKWQRLRDEKKLERASTIYVPNSNQSLSVTSQHSRMSRSTFHHLDFAYITPIEVFNKMDRCLCLDIAGRRLFYSNKIAMNFINYGGYKTIFVPGYILWKKRKDKKKILENFQLTTLIQTSFILGSFL